jgi:Flp pilus assembly protein TadG
MQHLNSRQRGNVAVEFALVMLMFVTLVVGAIDLSRWLYGINAAQEAAREGARVAVVCNLGSPAVASHMQPSLATLSSGTQTITWTPSGCCANEATCTPACTGVTVQLQGYRVPRIAPFLPTMVVPNVTTYLPRESMDSTGNARCT